MASRAQDLYWTSLVQLRVDGEYMCLYRDALSRWTTGFGMARAIVSGSALAAWVIVKEHPMVWGGVIAAAQMTEGVEKATSLAAHVRGAHALMTALDTLFIDCSREWERIFAGQLSEDEITEAWHRMMTQRHEADVKNLPGGLRQRKRLLRLAEREAATYLERTYGIPPGDEERTALPHLEAQ